MYVLGSVNPGLGACRSPGVPNRADAVLPSPCADGQTGSGKSYSMVGEVEDPAKNGIVLRCARELFEGELRQAVQNTASLMVEISMLEIYREKLRDLLVDKGAELRLRDYPGGAEIRGLTTPKCESYAELLKLMQSGLGRRTIDRTEMNETSSRAHTVFRIRIVRTEQLATGDVASTKGEINVRGRGLNRRPLAQCFGHLASLRGRVAHVCAVD
jgi:hypothetical protein